MRLSAGCIKVCWYSDAINAGCSEICDAQFCYLQVSEHELSEDGNLSTRQTVSPAADESDVRGSSSFWSPSAIWPQSLD